MKYKKNKIDTLILSGGGVRCLSFIGVMENLFTNHILSRDLHGIKTIISLSGGSLFILPFILKIPLTEIKRFIYNIDFKKMCNYEDFSMNHILLNHGLFNNNYISLVIDKCLQLKGYSKDISLIDLFKRSNIDYICRVYNLTDKREESMNHISHPHLSVSKLIQMTTCIPILFTPISHEGKLYIDGGIISNYPIDINTSSHYLGICMADDIKTKEIYNFIEYIQLIIRIHSNSVRKSDKKTIYISSSLKDTINFDCCMTIKKQFFRMGFSECGKFLFNNYKLFDS